jgi:hypothetical protein
MWLSMVRGFCLNFYTLGSKASSIHLSLFKVGWINFFTPYHALWAIFLIILLISLKEVF